MTKPKTKALTPASSKKGKDESNALHALVMQSLDDDQAQELGFSGAPIEGPTHFSQFDPLLHKIWGDTWFESGCISAHFKNVVVEGEEVQAFVELPAADARITKIWAVKKTGEPVLEGTASLGPEHPETRLDSLMASRPTPENLVLLEGVHIGDKSPDPDVVVMDFDQHLGNSYPFTLASKLEKITEKCRWYEAEDAAQPVQEQQQQGELLA